MKRILLFLLLLMTGVSLLGQTLHQAETFELNSPPPPGSNIYEASQYVLLNPGFEYTPTGTDFFEAHIDPMIVFPPYTGQFGGPPNNNSGGVVGTIPGNLMVTPTGAAVYSIAIDVPQGLANLTPELKFVYNNQAGDGIMGDGWSISGLSKISRAPFTYYFNNFTNSVVLDNEDQLTIDGNYLIKTDNNEYRLEQETFSKIVPIENNIENGFKVYKRNGLIYYYGHREDARYYLQSCNTPIAWYLARIEDLNKNYIEFYYTNDKAEGSYYPDKILYTGNSKTGQDAFYKIKFIYNQNPLNREDTPKKYFGAINKNGSIFSRITRHLNNVIITHIPTNTIIKNYHLYYQYKGYFSKKYLTSIYLYPGYDKEKGFWYNPTRFDWHISEYVIDTKEKELFLDDFSQGTKIQKDVFPANFDEEPKSDLLHCSKNEISGLTSIRAYLNQSNYYPNALLFDFSVGNYNPWYDYTFQENVVFLSPGDFNGDGIDEVICVYKKADPGYYYTIGSFDFSSDDPYIEGEEIYINLSSNDIYNCIISDFSGNGYSDLCIITNNGLQSNYFFFLSDEVGPLNNVVTNANVYTEIPEKILTGDFNGNAKTELLVVGTTSSDIISLFTNNEDFSAESTTDDFCQITNSRTDIVAGDFNSDAKTDVLLLNGNSENNWMFYFSCGKGDFVQNPPITNEEIGASEILKYAVDVNGDKYSDICMIYHNYSNDTTINYYRRDFLINPKNSGIEVIVKNLEDSITFISNNGVTQEVDFCFGNFSGNSSNQLIASRISRKNAHYDNWYTDIHLSAPIYNSYINAVSKITNGFGVEKKINYCPFTSIPRLSDKHLYSENTRDLEFPVVPYTGILNVVTSYEQDVEQDQSLTVNYYYLGAKYHKIGKGFLGFDEVHQSNELNGTYTIRYFNIDNNYFHIVNNKTEVRPISNLFKLISENTNNYNFRDMNDPEHLCYFPYLENSVKINYDLSENIIKKYKVEYNNYDIWGNPKEIIEHYGNDGLEYPIRKTRTINYKNLTENNMHVIGLIDDVETTFHKDNNTDIIKNIDYEYYENTTALLKSETIEPNDAKSYTIHYNYDDGNETYGNLTEKKLTATGMENRVSTYSYSQDGRSKLSFTNPKNHIEEYTYYEKTGLLKTHTDVNQLTTTFEYDKFGRINKEIYPNGTFVQTVQRWTIPGYANEHEDAPSTANYYEWKKSPGSSEILTFYDKFNNEVRKVTTSFDGTKIYEDKEYLGTPTFSGLLWHHSNPYFKNDEAVWTNTIFDIYRRPVEINMPDGSEELYSYLRNTKTITGFDGQTKKLEYNGAGWLTKVTDNNEGIINYNHRSDGLVKNITINSLQSTMVSKTYDAFGQTESLTDPDNGTTTYTYNAFGDLISETDELNTITYTPDKLGRITERIAPDGYTIWQYDTQNFGVGKLHTVVHAPLEGEIRQVIRENVYNNLGYLSEQKQIINGKQIKFNYSYDVYGRQRRLTWPSGYQTINCYNEYGYLVSIRNDNSKFLWEATEMNAWGMVTKSKIGNNINNEYIYDALNGRITDITAGTNSSYDNLQNMQYEWKTDGNLDFRKDNIKNLNESFQYDSFNRLQKVFLNNELQLETGFNIIGNINTKSDVGTYGYNYNTRPHAVTSITGSQRTISPLDQTIEYTSFDKVKHISEGENNDDTYTLDISYGPEHNRVWQKFDNNVTGETVTKRYFNTIYEKITDENGNEKQLHYLAAPNGLFAIFTIQNDEVENINYILKDHLGSINYILNEDGTVAQEMNFDAWGRRRNAQTWTYNNIQTNFMFDRGYTMHEHLNAFKIINMNGRMYDPIVARFLSPDPFVQMPEYSQNYNRYSYVLNNPLRFTDPSGYVFSENFDWFINNITGDVYYNSEYRKGDESKIDGEGWEWFGENGIFSKDLQFNDYQIILKNSYLLSRFSQNMKYDKSLVFNDSKLENFSIEATFKGKNAEVFMSMQGYDLKPKEYKFHKNIKTVYHPDVMLITQTFNNSRIEKVLSYQYVSKNLFLNKSIVLSHYDNINNGFPKSYGLLDPSFSITNQSWTVQQDIYGERPFDKYLKNAYKLIDKLGIPWKDLWGEFCKRRLN